MLCVNSEHYFQIKKNRSMRSFDVLMMLVWSDATIAETKMSREKLAVGKSAARDAKAPLGLLQEPSLNACDSHVRGLPRSGLKNKAYASIHFDFTNL